MSEDKHNVTEFVISERGIPMDLSSNNVKITAWIKGDTTGLRPVDAEIVDASSGLVQLRLPTVDEDSVMQFEIRQNDVVVGSTPKMNLRKHTD